MAISVRVLKTMIISTISIISITEHWLLIPLWPARWWLLLCQHVHLPAGVPVFIRGYPLIWHAMMSSQSPVSLIQHVKDTSLHPFFSIHAYWTGLSFFSHRGICMLLDTEMNSYAMGWSDYAIQSKSTAGYSDWACLHSMYWWCHV